MLGGRYAQLGTFELYQDRALLDARRVILEVALLGKPSHVMSFPKMAKVSVEAFLCLIPKEGILCFLHFLFKTLLIICFVVFGGIVKCVGGQICYVVDQSAQSLVCEDDGLSG